MLIKINDELWVNPDQISSIQKIDLEEYRDLYPGRDWQVLTGVNVDYFLSNAEFKSLLEEVNGEEGNICGWAVQVPIEEYNELKKMEARLASLEK